MIQWHQTVQTLLAGSSYGTKDGVVSPTYHAYHPKFDKMLMNSTVYLLSSFKQGTICVNQLIQAAFMLS